QTCALPIFDPTLVAIGKGNLRESWIHIDECAPPRPLVLLSPIPKRHRSHNEKVRTRTHLLKIFERHPERAIIVPINPSVPKAKRFQTGMHISRWIIQLVSPLLLLPYVNPGGATAIFQVKHFVSECPQAQ